MPLLRHGGSGFMICFRTYAVYENFNIAPEIRLPKRKLVFQQLLFRGYVKLPGGYSPKILTYRYQKKLKKRGPLGKMYLQL